MSPQTVPLSYARLEPASDDVVGAVSNKEIGLQIDSVLAELTEQEAAVLRCRYFHGMTLRQTGESLDRPVSVGRTQQIEAKALRKLRDPSRIRRLENLVEGLNCELKPERPVRHTWDVDAFLQRLFPPVLPASPALSEPVEFVNEWTQETFVATTEAELRQIQERASRDTDWVLKRDSSDDVTWLISSRTGRTRIARNDLPLDIRVVIEI